MATLERFNPRTGDPLGGEVSLRGGELTFSDDDGGQAIRDIMETTLARVSPATAFHRFTGYSNSQGLVGLRLKEGQ